MWTANLWTFAFNALNSWWMNQIDLFSTLKCKFSLYRRIIDSSFSSEWQMSCRLLCLKIQCIFDFCIKAYFTTLDNQLWPELKMFSKENKHMLLKPIYVGLRICWKICKIMLEKGHKCNIYQKECCGYDCNCRLGKWYPIIGIPFHQKLVLSFELACISR